jgi:hypothetical protein
VCAPPTPQGPIAAAGLGVAVPASQRSRSRELPRCVLLGAVVLALRRWELEREPIRRSHEMTPPLVAGFVAELPLPAFR